MTDIVSASQTETVSTIIQLWHIRLKNILPHIVSYEKTGRMQHHSNTILYPLSSGQICHEQIRWSNNLINSPMCYTLLERRVMYFLTGQVKKKFLEKGLGIPENWKELVFHLQDKDLGVIGGKKNVPRTYDTLSSLGGKFYPIRYKNEMGNIVIGKIHWIDSFFYDKDRNLYAVRVSPEIMGYLVNLTHDFTSFDLGTAMILKSRFSQKIYELCCEFSGNFRFHDNAESQFGNIYKERVVPIHIDSLRNILNLNEINDERTGKSIKSETYKDFTDIRRFILEYAQRELYSLYMMGKSNLWFDFQPGKKTGNGGKISYIIIFIYTREHPKVGEQRPWEKGDAPLIPYETELAIVNRKTPYQKLYSNIWYGNDNLDIIVRQMLSRYLTKKEVEYYMMEILRESRQHKDSYIQVLQVLQEKEDQPKFSSGTKQYKRNNIIDYALKENLKVYGWSIQPPFMRKKRSLEQDLFE